MKKEKQQSKEENILSMLEKKDLAKRSKILNLGLQKTAQDILNYKIIKRLLVITALCLAIVITTFFVTSLMYSRYSSFTVSVNKFQELNYSLEISDSSSFEAPTNKLTCPSVENITNIDGDWLDWDEIGSIDGEDNGENYLCYTFYVRNNGNVGVHVDYNMTIGNVEKNLDEAIRVAVIYSRDNTERVKTVYARAAGVDQETHESIPEEGTTMFESQYTILTNHVEALMPGEVMKFTIVIWIEGPDEDCLDDKIGGLIETDMAFEVSGVMEEN